jgi:hypothetical protein
MSGRRDLMKVAVEIFVRRDEDLDQRAFVRMRPSTLEMLNRPRRASLIAGRQSLRTPRAKPSAGAYAIC